MLLLAAAAGCGGSSDKWTANRPKTVPAEGVVTYNGERVAGATVVFVPESVNSETIGASALTSSSGEFSLSTFPPDTGAVPGRYRVGVTKLQAVARAPAGPDSHDLAAPTPPPQNLLPQQYSDPLQSGLIIDIPEAGTTDLAIELQ